MPLLPRHFSAPRRRTNGSSIMKPLRMLLLALALLSAKALLAEPPPSRPGDGMFEKYLALKAAALDAHFLDGVTTLAEWQRRRPQLKQELLDMLGLWPLPERTP